MIQRPPEIYEFFALTPDLVCIAGKDGYFKHVNPAVEKLLEYSRDELFSQPISNFIHPEDRAVTAQRREALLNGKMLTDFENRYLSKSGKIYWLSWTSVYVPDKKQVFAIAKNVTERHLQQEILEKEYSVSKGLARHFKHSLEKDRREMADELHEELAQQVAALKMEVDMLTERLRASGDAGNDRLDRAAQIAENLIRSIRRMSFSLSPHLIKDIGFHATLHYQCREFSAEHGIPCELETDIADTEINPEHCLDLFHIAQAALSNVHRHANASMVRVTVTTEGKGICFSIQDNGQGFDASSVTMGEGLEMARQRAQFLMAEFNLFTAPGEGTKIEVVLARQERQRISA